MSTLEDLLREATMELESHGPGSGGVIEGTGFLVAPGIVATCAHVLADRREELPGTVAARTHTGRELLLEAVPEWYLREQAGGLDLAFLRAPSDTGPHVLLSGVVETGESVWTWGHPAGRFRAGQSALFTAQGASRLRAVDADGRPLGGEWQPERVFGTPVGGGYSGSAVLSRRTGAVCGMLFSHKAGSAHIVSAAVILAALPQVAHGQSDPACNIRWLGHLDDEQIRIGGWPYPGPRLRAYLDAAILMAREHPYPGVVPGTRPPPLTVVHLSQQAQSAPTRTQDGVCAASLAERLDDVAVMSSQKILDHDGGAVVTAGPGGGKSTLLRTGLITVAERWREDQSGRCIPVLVPAADLALPRPLHEALADSVKKSLSTAAPAHDWPPQFFNTEPLVGVRWLVMVDGLDEITDPEVRRGLINKLANASARPGSPYQFIATSRPLSELPEQQAGGWPGRRYELLPFTAEDLDWFAEGWFTALDLPEPQRAARDFTGELRLRSLEGLARTPLMATMLCQLYSAHPRRPLPADRGQIYQGFVDLLHKRQRAAGLRAQTRAALEECGSDALAAADKTLNHLQDLIAFLADERRLGNTTPALDLIAAQPAAARPKRVPEADWRIILEESLRSSGLLTTRAGEAVFLHQTLLEYLAAWHATRNAAARARAYKALNRPFRKGLGTYPWNIGIRQGRKFWLPPTEDSDSFVGFLLDLGQDETTDLPRDLDRLLKHLATRGGIAGGEFIARQARLGTRLPEGVVHAAADNLLKLIRTQHIGDGTRLRAVEALVLLGDQRGADLAEVVARHTGFKGDDRVRMAEALVLLGDQRGTDLLGSLASDTDVEGLTRVLTARKLAGLDHQRAVDILGSLARDTDLGSRDRVLAVEGLAGLDHERGADLAESLALDSGLDNGWRIRAVKTLAGLDHERGADHAESLALDSGLDGRYRVSAVETLAGLDHQRGTDLAESLARHSGLDGRYRVWMALTMALLGDQRGTDLLASLACDRTIPEWVRKEAARAEGVAASRVAWRRGSHI
ncbi:trypsin-like peptidase domain-containing protein [Streptomyces sp. NPDC057301]|uniref:trypsin-like peptidase domain-containing protein n=1 Tax=Streptomyces sp. NPDC057301 TaxID=3346093 RepID=UPI0036401B56